MKLVSVFCFAFISPKFAQILKYFAQSCDCMIAAFKNSGVPCDLGYGLKRHQHFEDLLILFV